MSLKSVYTLLIAVCLGLNVFVTHAAPPSTETKAVIEELGLRAAASPIRENAHWQPRKVAVKLPNYYSGQWPGYEEALTEAAGGVELVFDRSDDFSMSAEVLAGADGIIGLCMPTTMQNADERLLWLHNYSVGMDYCQGLNEQQVERIQFTNNKRLSGPTIAEHTIAMMMSLARGLPMYQRAQADNEWQQGQAAKVRFGEIKGKTLLVVGLGGIGTQIAWRAHGLGMRVIATRNSSRTGPDYVDYVGLSDELLKLAAEADVIVNALPLTAKTTGIFDAAFFKAAKPGALFLSVGRGKSTVTADLVAALASGQIYGAGLDVTEPEPLPRESPLWQMENVIITPHASSISSESLRRSALIAVENLRRYVAGEALLNMVDIRAGY